MKNKQLIIIICLLLSPLIFNLKVNINSDNNNAELVPNAIVNVENPVPSAPLTPKNAYAVIVGISDYPGSSADLSYCDDDSQDIYSMLTNEYNFKPENIIYLQDSSATKGAISNALDQMASQISSDDVFFFYYSGHGGFGTEVGPYSWTAETPHNYPNDYDNIWSVYHSGAAYMRVHFYRLQCEYNYDFLLCGDSDVASGYYYQLFSGDYGYNFWSAYIPVNRYYLRFISDYSITYYGFRVDMYEAILDDGTHYLCSYDSIPDSPSNYYIDSLLNSKLGNIDCLEKYVVLDSCHSGGMIPEVQSIGRYIMTACQDDESSLESPSLQHGVFTNYFLNSLEFASDSNSDGVKSLEECFSYVYSNTVSYSGSMGYTHHPQQYDGISGEAVLSTSFGALNLNPIQNNLSYSFYLYGTGLIEELKIVICNISSVANYKIEDFTLSPASNTGFGYYSGTLELNGVSGLTGYGIFAKIQGNNLIYLNNTTSIDSDQDSLDDVLEILIGSDPISNDTDSDGLDDGFEYNGITNPLSNDTDNDGMDDYYEVIHNLNPIFDDSNDDQDGDGLNNLLEYELGSFPDNNDTDNDGMEDGWEYAYNLNLTDDDSSFDEDSDGLNNLDEFNLQTDPCNNDSDGDTLLDGIEVYTYNTNPANNDTDGEGLTDNLEILVYFTNATNSDTEGDGMDDYYEITYGFDPFNNDSGDDTDYDGLSNLLECQYGTNPLNPDTDGDSINDYYEIQCNLNPLIDDADEDNDNDGLSNLLEFLLGSNADDVDSDNDQMPDFWEYNNGLNLTVNDAYFDNDNDGLNNINEYNIGTNPQNSDTDYDDLTDGNEVQIYFTDPLNPDTDGDGYNDGVEVLWGSNPLDPRISLNTIFLNIAGGILIIGSSVYAGINQIYVKKHKIKKKIPKGKFSVDKQSDGYNVLSVKKEMKPKPVYKPRTYTPSYTYSQPKFIPQNLNEVRNIILYGLPTPKSSYSMEGQRALIIANNAFKLFNQGQYQASIQSMLQALMLGVPEPMNSRLKKIILDSLDRVISSTGVTKPPVPTSSASSILTEKCSSCGTINRDINKFCKNCGKPLERSYLIKKCGFCGTSNENSNKFCTKCGREL